MGVRVKGEKDPAEENGCSWQTSTVLIRNTIP